MYLLQDSCLSLFLSGSSSSFFSFTFFLSIPSQWLFVACVCHLPCPSQSVILVEGLKKLVSLRPKHDYSTCGEGQVTCTFFLLRSKEWHATAMVRRWLCVFCCGPHTSSGHLPEGRYWTYWNWKGLSFVMPLVACIVLEFIFYSSFGLLSAYQRIMRIMSES